MVLILVSSLSLDSYIRPIIGFEGFKFARIPNLLINGVSSRDGRGDTLCPPFPFQLSSLLVSLPSLPHLSARWFLSGFRKGGMLITGPPARPADWCRGPVFIWAFYSDSVGRASL